MFLMDRAKQFHTTCKDMLKAHKKAKKKTQDSPSVFLHWNTE